MSLFDTGGTIDSLFDFLRSNLGEAVSYCVPYLKDRLKITTNRSECGRVLFNYNTSVKNKSITPYAGAADVNSKTIADTVASSSGVGSDLVLYILTALQDGAKNGNDSCSTILAGQETPNLADTILNTGIVNTISSTVSGTIDTVASAIGIPRGLITAALIAAIGFGLFILVKKLKKL